MVERMSTTKHTSQNAIDVNYAAQDQANFDQITKSAETNVTIKLLKAYKDELRQGIVIERIPHKDKSQSAAIKSKKSAYSHESNALGLDKTVACMKKASTTEIKRHKNVSAGPTTTAPSSSFSTFQECHDLADTIESPSHRPQEPGNQESLGWIAQ